MLCFKLGSDQLKSFLNPFYRIFHNLPINFTFWGGFAVDADFSDAFSGSIEGPKIDKNR
jgi:hypothetical protein